MAGEHRLTHTGAYLCALGQDAYSDGPLALKTSSRSAAPVAQSGNRGNLGSHETRFQSPATSTASTASTPSSAATTSSTATGSTSAPSVAGTGDRGQLPLDMGV